MGLAEKVGSTAEAVFETAVDERYPTATAGPRGGIPLAGGAELASGPGGSTHAMHTFTEAAFFLEGFRQALDLPVQQPDRSRDQRVRGVC